MGRTFQGWIISSAVHGSLRGRKAVVRETDGRAAGGEDGLLGALADGGGEEGLETDGGLLGRFMPE